MMFRSSFILFLLFCVQTVGAQQETDAESGGVISCLNLETRLGYEMERQDGRGNNEPTGFKGQYLNLRIDGELVHGLTYSYRQRLNKNSDQRFFDATDWIHLDYAPTEKWQLSAGKQVVAIGGYEYDRAPIDLYYNSEFWYNIACYQLGVSAAYRFTVNQQLKLQVCNSPFRAWAGNNTYGINVIWYGQCGWWQSAWSVNAFQRSRDQWSNYMALGNRFLLGSRTVLELDYTNRAAAHQTFLFRDCSVVGELSVAPVSGTRIFAKYTFDQNRTHTDADLLVTQGTRLHSVGGGVEYHPLKKHSEALRLFGAVAYSWGENTNSDGVLSDGALRWEAGVKWRIDVLDAFNHVVNKLKNKDK